MIGNGYITSKILELELIKVATNVMEEKKIFLFFVLFSGAKAENLETKCDSSVLGMLCKMELWGDAERWWAWVNEVAAAVGLCILQREAEVGFGPQTRNRAV